MRRATYCVVLGASIAAVLLCNHAEADSLLASGTLQWDGTLVAGDGWKTAGTSVEWEVTTISGGWRYSYELLFEEGTAIGDLSHVIIETSPNLVSVQQFPLAL
ncbi:MAG: hypothetical protein HQ567_16580 [Candidatus Nealsonbacteria bacterium]|nr:hypothetical protein [Candidatus Nealsonbacteria bacterium]